MIRKDVLLGIVVVIAILAALTYNTMQLGSHSCKVCITYKSNENCATASGSTRAEAVKTAVTTACGPISGGVTETIQCGNLAPDSVEWLD